MDKKDSQMCTSCKTEVESIFDYHLFWDWILLQQLIHDLETVLALNDLEFNFRDIGFQFGYLDANVTNFTGTPIICDEVLPKFWSHFLSR